MSRQLGQDAKPKRKTTTMTKNPYNGYTNYETWNVKLWIDNDQGSQEYWADQAQNLLEQYARNEREAGAGEVQAVLELEEILKGEHEDALPELTGFAADLLNAAMSEVNWREIAQDLVDEANGGES